MLDRQATALTKERGGVSLSRQEFKRDFWTRRAAIRGGESWKLERRQHFEEDNDESRDALRRGDWQEALRLFDSEREDARGAAREEAARGSVFHRIRVVEEPLTPYVQWELHWLLMRAECGHSVRVLPATALAAAETDGPLPEVTILGGQILYRVRYTSAGKGNGAVRFTDPQVVAPWVEFVRSLHAAAEDISTFFDRAVAHLPPPPAA